MNSTPTMPGGISTFAEAARLGIAILGFLMAGMAKLLPVNDYAAQGIGGYDCDGPMGVGLFLFPAVMFASIAAVLWFRGGRPWLRHTGLILSLVALVLAMTVFPDWYTELVRNGAATSPCN